MIDLRTKSFVGSVLGDPWRYPIFLAVEIIFIIRTINSYDYIGMTTSRLAG